jgi:hypothetical protein
MGCDSGLLASNCDIGGITSSLSEDLSTAEQKLAQAFQAARNQFVSSFLK